MATDAHDRWEVIPMSQQPRRSTRRARRRKTRPTWLAVALGFLGWLGAPMVAHATCPPFEMENTWLGVINQWRERQVTQERAEAMMRQGAIPRFPVTLWPPSGPAPLNVGLLWWMRPADPPQAIEIDADGDGVPEVSDTREENLGHVYQKAGQFAATIRVRGHEGRVTTYAAPVTVLSPEAFDAELQGRWTALKTALQQGDLSGAIECVHSEFRRRIYNGLAGLVRGPVENELPPIRFVELRVPEAIYRSVRPVPRQTRLQDVRFQPDMDGVWRLTSVFQQAGVEP